MSPTHFTTVRSQIAEILSSGCTWCWFKVPASFFAGAFAFLLGPQNYMGVVAVVILVTIDLLTAVMGEYVAGRPIESRKFLKSATKTVVYSLFLVATHLTEFVVPGTTFLDEMVLSFLALTEMISVMENIGKMGYSVPLKLLNKLQDLRDKDK